MTVSDFRDHGETAPPRSAARAGLSPFRRGRRLQLVLALSGFALIGLLWTGLLLYLGQREGEAIAQSERDVANLSVAIEAQVERLIVGVDQAMRFFQNAYRRDPRGVDFADWMRQADSLDGVTVQIALIDEQGGTVGARIMPKPGLPQTNAADRAYFKVQAARGDAGLFIDHALVGRVSGRYAIQMSRRMTRPDGSFGGVLLVSLDPDYLARQFRTIDVGQGGSVALIGRDGFLRARFPAVAGMYDADLGKTPDGRALMGCLASDQADVCRIEAPTREGRQILSHRAVGATPLSIVVSKSASAALAPIDKERGFVYLVGALVSLCFLGVGAFLLREVELRFRRAVDLRAAHDALRERTAELDATLEHVAQGILMIDAAGDVPVCNGRALKLLDLPAGLMAGRPPFREVVRLRPLAGEAVGAAQAGLPAFAVAPARVCEREAPDGTVLEIRTVPRLGGGAVTTYADITARRRAEHALRDSESFLRGVIDGVGDCIKVLDLDGTLRFISRNGQCLMDIEDPSSVLGKPFGLLWTAERHADLAAALDTARAGRPAHLFASCTTAKGKPLELDVLVTPILGADGAPERLVAIARDVTHLRMAEKAVREGERRFRLLADNTSDLIVLLRPDGRFGYVSPAVAPMLGYAVAETEGTLLRDWVDPADAEAILRTAKQLSPLFPTASLTFRLRRKDGSHLWAEAALRRVDEPGAEGNVVAAIRDVSERREKTEELRAAKETAEAARAAADQASRAKTEFLACMSHEIRTPLNAIIGFTDLIADSRRLPPDLQRHADLVRSSGSALLTLVNDILDFSKIEAGAVALVRQPFAPLALVENCLSIVRGAALAKGIELKSNVDLNLPAGLLGDESRLRQVLLNLLNNAVKFTRSGSVTLSLRHERTDGQGEHLRLSVADTGIGIPKEKQHRLFQRFSQIDGSVARDFGGTGLGLAISKRLVELMGGEIGVFSEEGQGATFWFTLALPRARVDAQLLPVANDWMPQKRGRLLLVEDVPVNQELGRLVLEAAGHTVDVAADGAAAITAVEQAEPPYDLVLMDVQMPGMDGIAATRRIRALAGARRGVPVVAMTANVLPEQVRQFREAGMDDHVGKPFQRAELYATVDRWLPEKAALPRAGEREADASFDRAAYRELADLLGEDAVAGLALKLHEELGARFPRGRSASLDRAALRRDAHAVVPAAAMLGFGGLAAACRALQDMLDRGDMQDFDATLDAVRIERRRAMAELDILSGAGSDSASSRTAQRAAV